MYRKELIDILRDHPMSIHDLAVLLVEPLKDVVDERIRKRP